MTLWQAYEVFISALRIHKVLSVHMYGCGGVMIMNFLIVANENKHCQVSTTDEDCWWRFFSCKLHIELYYSTILDTSPAFRQHFLATFSVLNRRVIRSEFLCLIRKRSRPFERRLFFYILGMFWLFIKKIYQRMI